MKNVDLLYHEATYADDHQNEAAAFGHSTAREAAQIARSAKVSALLLGHLSGRYRNWEEHLAEAKEFFENTSAAEDGTIITI